MNVTAEIVVKDDSTFDICDTNGWTYGRVDPCARIFLVQYRDGWRAKPVLIWMSLFDMASFIFRP